MIEPPQSVWSCLGPNWLPYTMVSLCENIWANGKGYSASMALVVSLSATMGSRPWAAIKPWQLANKAPVWCNIVRGACDRKPYPEII